MANFCRLLCISVLATAVVSAVSGCATVAVNPAQLMPLVEIQVNDTETAIDDYVWTSATPCRARITNHGRFSTDLDTDLRVYREDGGGDIVYAASAAGATSGSLPLVLPEDGSWAPFYVTAVSGSARATDKDVAIEMVADFGSSAVAPGLADTLTVLARHALMTTDAAPVAPLAQIEIQVVNSPTTIDDYLTWSPTLCRARIVNEAAFSSPLSVTVQNASASGGQLAFAATLPSAGSTATATSIGLTLPEDGSWSEFYVAGAYGTSGSGASERDKDAVMEVRDGAGDLLTRHAVMVRVRKNANDLSDSERDRFLEALVSLNLTFDLYQDFQDIHSIASGEAHGGSAFLPWHRAFVLHLERQLQAIDPSVAIPYWRFDMVAADVFSPSFMGAPPSGGGTASVFDPTNPLSTWTVSGLSGIPRLPMFAPTTSSPSVNSEVDTLALGSDFSSFRSMESDPHDPSHWMTGGWGNPLSSVPTAVQDPLFFLLHCNVDRLWAKWQWTYDQWDPTDSSAYEPQGGFDSIASPTWALGQYVEDTMWPWNDEVGGVGLEARPATAPGDPIPQVAGQVLSPPARPRPWDVIDYRTNRLFTAPSRGLGFAYDDVPF